MEETATSIWTSKDIITAVIATGVLSAFASTIVDMVKAWYGKKSAARYAAMRSAVALERYAVDCWHMFSMGIGEFHVSQDVSANSLPPHPELPSDIDWKVLDRDLADQVLSFSNASSVTESLAEYARVWEHNPFDYHAAAKERGLEALKLAGRLRTFYEMPPQTGYDRLWKDFSK